MNCGVFCVREYLRLMGIDSGGIIKELDGRVTRRGLVMQDIIEVLRDHGIVCEGYYDPEVCYDFPYIMYDAVYRHYYLVISGDDRHVWMCDPLLGYVRVRRWFFRLFWRKYYVSLRYSVI